MTDNIDMDARQSRLITAMRFPLIVLVVFAHSLGFEVAGITASPDGWNIYHFFSEMISHNLARLAVCWFYAISGYFFFRYLKDGDFNFKWVLAKWKKRIWTLLIPYLIWNLLAVGITALKCFSFSRMGIGTENDMPEFNVLYWFWNGPANFPLYFMRDLMVMSLIAPLLYLFFKRFRWLGLAILVCLYVSPLRPGIPSMRAISFFTLGVWLGTWKVNMLAVCRKVKWPAAALAIVCLLVASYFNTSPYHEWMLRAFYPFGMITFMNLCDGLIDNENRYNRLVKLSSTVFFIYGAHEILILGWTKGAFLRVFGDGLLGSWISYLFVPVVVLLVCLGLYWIVNKFIPGPLAFACGGRTNKKQ